jgi:RNA polymerase sigma factor for flagellar operon FliA
MNPAADSPRRQRLVKERTMPAIKSSSRRASPVLEPRRGPALPRDHAKDAPDPRRHDELWRQFHARHDEESRNRLIEAYLPLVRYNAERLHARLPDEVDVEDLMQAGLFGLVDAINAFDTSRNVKFETYCAPRIRGAILDELRSMDWVPRLVRHRAGRMAQARERVEVAKGRPATPEEIARELGLEGEELEKFIRDGRAVMTISITRKAPASDGRETRDIDVARDDGRTDPFREIQRRDLRDLITRGLSRAERLIVILYYYEGMTMKEIGATLNLSESRVSQMHSSILLRLKSQMQHRTRELEPVE